MGWTCMRKPNDVRQYLINLLTWETDEGVSRPLDLAIVQLTTAYAAIETTLKSSGKKYVWAVVVLIEYRPQDDPYGFCVKELGEDVGPFVNECPERVLQLLTDTPHDNDSSRRWREQCWRNVNERKALTERVRNWKPGILLEYTDGEGIRFKCRGDNLVLRRLRLYDKRRHLFTNEQGRGFYRVPRRFWKHLKAVETGNGEETPCQAIA